MDMNTYQQEASQTAIYPRKGTGEIEAVEYCVLGLTGESGEAANKLQKVLRDCDGILDGTSKAAIARELGGALWYISQTARELGFDLTTIALWNLHELASRKERGTLQGSGDER